MIIFFPILFLFPMMKEFLFIGTLFYLDSGLCLMLYIFPLVIFLIKKVNFNFISVKEEFYYMFLFFFVIFFLVFCFNSLNSMHFLIFLENCVIFMVFLIFWFSKDSDKISAALFMFFINIMPSIFFMYFCWNWDMSLLLNLFFLKESSKIFCFFCFIGLLVSKLPLFFFHFWLTKAHVSASGSGSMILASLMLKIGTIGFYKFYYFFFNNFKMLSSGIFLVSCLGMTFILVIMTRFLDLKYAVACSSIVHMSSTFPFCIQGVSDSVYACFLMMVGHGLVSYYIFFLVSVIYESSYNRSMDFNKSLSSFSTLLITFFFFFFFLNMGFPPLCSFISELIFLRSFSLISVLLCFIFCLSLCLSGFLFFFVVSKSLFGKKLVFISGVLNYNTYMSSIIFFFSFFLIPFIYF